MVTPQDCIFCKIIRNEIPSKNIYEDNDNIAFLDINPASPGHVLVVPKKHFANMHDIDDANMQKLSVAVKKVNDIVKNNLNAEATNIFVNNGRLAGQIVDHVHVHIIPRYKGDGIELHFPRYKTDENYFNEMQQKLTEKKSLAEEWKEY